MIVGAANITGDLDNGKYENSAFYFLDDAPTITPEYRNVLHL